MEKTRTQIVNTEIFTIKLVWEETKCPSVGDRLNKIWNSKYLFKEIKPLKFIVGPLYYLGFLNYIKKCFIDYLQHLTMSDIHG